MGTILIVNEPTPYHNYFQFFAFLIIVINIAWQLVNCKDGTDTVVLSKNKYIAGLFLYIRKIGV